jgi:ATP-dependent DNA ligase
LHFITQNGNNATQRFAPVALMLEKLRVKQAIIEGEVAVPDARGVTNLSLLDVRIDRSSSRMRWVSHG